VVLPSPSVSPLPPIIYDTIEVMLEPPPEFLAEKPIFVKRKNSRVAVRRSKRRKLDSDDRDSSLERENTVLNNTEDPHRLVETESAEFAHQDIVAEEIRAEEVIPVEPSANKDPELESERQETHTTVLDITPAPTPKQIPTFPIEIPSPTPPSAQRLTSTASSTPDPPEIHDSINVPPSIAKSHESEDIDDWLMTDIDPSVDEERSTQTDPILKYDSFSEDVTGAAQINDETDHAFVADNPSAIAANDSQFQLPEIDARPVNDPQTTFNENCAFQPDLEDESSNDESAMDLDEPHLDALSKVTDHVDPVTTLIDEARMSLPGSVIESPSPPLRTLLPRPIIQRPLAATVFGPSRPSPTREMSRFYESDSGEFQETADDFMRSTMAVRASPASKQTSASPYSNFDVPDVRSRRSRRRIVDNATGLRMPMSIEFPASTNPSGASSSLSSPVSRPTPPSPSPSPVDRALSPSFGLRTTPRPVGRPPLRPVRGGLRYVNHDTDARSKLLMARPKTAIPTHIDSTQYARECLDAAVFCRLPPYNLDPAEHRLLRTHINHVQVTTYLNVRNGILRLWMLNPTIAVCREESLGVAKEERHLELVAKCHEFLVRHGYINFGCVVPPRPLSRPAGEAYVENPLRRRKRVVIVGAGAAGLGCARQLESLFVQFADRFPRNEELPEVVVLEGRDRIGGRIHSHPLVVATVPERPCSSSLLNSKLSTLSVSSVPRPSSLLGTVPLQRQPDPAVDLGAQIVTGFDNGNPLAPIIKRQLRLRWHHLHDDSLLFNDQDGARVDGTEDIRAEKLFNDILDRASTFKEKVREQPSIEGDRELMDQGKEPHGESGRQIAKVEENEAILPPMPPSPFSANRDSPISNHPSPKRPSQKHRIPSRRALTKMGFKLKDSESKPRKADIDHLSAHTTLGDMMKTILIEVQGLVDLSPMDLKLLNWHWANLEYGNATNLNRLSLKHWDQDDGNEYLVFKI
jgi:hypothetical protein